MQVKQQNTTNSVEYKKSTAQKKKYVTPKLESVKLFADSVLTSCRLNPSAGCSTIEPVLV
ncbi:MAG: hypothetical protein D3903_07875 [Candidatus Electrothrix sp. GM3_4]|nr:hypothetical protein [Candidatus Electrothrix sp. GM3_4]